MKDILLLEDIVNNSLLNNYYEKVNAVNSFVSAKLKSDNEYCVRIILPSYEYILRCFKTKIGKINLLSDDYNDKSDSTIKIIPNSIFNDYLRQSLLDQSTNGLSVNRINLKDISKYINSSEYENAIHDKEDDALIKSIKNTARKDMLFIAMIKISSLSNDVNVVYDPVVPPKGDLNNNNNNARISPNHSHSLCINVKGLNTVNINTENLNKEIENTLLEILETALIFDKNESFKLEFNEQCEQQIHKLIIDAFNNNRIYKNGSKDVSIHFPNTNNCKYIIDPENPNDKNTNYIIRPRKLNESYTNTEGLDDITYHKLYRFC